MNYNPYTPSRQRYLKASLVAGAGIFVLPRFSIGRSAPKHKAE